MLLEDTKALNLFWCLSFVFVYYNAVIALIYWEVVMKNQNQIMEAFSFDNESAFYASQGKLVAVGTVIDEKEGNVWVLTERNTGCSGCSAESGCGTSALAKLFSPNNKAPLKLNNDLGVKVGDRVLLSIVESDLFKHSMMAYGLPLFSMIVLAWIGLMATQNDGVSILGGIVGLGLGWWFAKHYYQPHLPKMEKVIQVQ